MDNFHPVTEVDNPLYMEALRGGLVTVWRNSRYQVIRTVLRPTRPDGSPAELDATNLVWLSIKRLDRAPIHDWRDLQEIKNKLVGPECEGVELYPAESRKVDTSNQFHLFVWEDPTFRLPFGYSEREVLDAEEAARSGAMQRPLSRQARRRLRRR